MGPGLAGGRRDGRGFADVRGECEGAGGLRGGRAGGCVGGGGGEGGREAEKGGAVEGCWAEEVGGPEAEEAGVVFLDCLGNVS